MKILSPQDGAILNRRHGRLTAAGLEIKVVGRAPAGRPVTVNGVAAQRNGDAFEANITLAAQNNVIIAAAEGSDTQRARVLWDRHSRPRYRVALDDNSFCFKDVAANQYASLFDNFYFRMLRDLHQRFGSKFVLNTYYYGPDGFDLTQFPDRYRGEWQDNAGWLKLAFHALADKPPRPYENATPEKLAADIDLVHHEILRFAGEPSLSPPTVIHWCMLPAASLPVLNARGTKVLSGLFLRKDDRFDINYSLDNERSAYLLRNKALMDHASGIIFSKVDMVVNNTPLARIVPELAGVAADPARAEIIDLLTHEQYFWPSYGGYLPDHPERLAAALQFCTESGYEPVFFHEGLLGLTEPSSQV